MDEQLMSWANARPEVTEIQHPSGLSVKLKYMWRLQHISTVLKALDKFELFCFSGLAGRRQE